MAELATAWTDESSTAVLTDDRNQSHAGHLSCVAVPPPLPSVNVVPEARGHALLSETSDEMPTVATVRPLHQPFRLSGSSMPGERFISLARWEGVVESLRDDEFDARLVDIMGSESDVTATFSKEDLSEEDRRHLQIGAVFYWIIGYLENAARQRSRIAVLKFRRLPARRQGDVARARLEAKAIRSELGLE